MRVRLEPGDIKALARGCAVLGAGGGGDPLLASLMAERALSESDGVEILALDELPPEDLVVPCGLIGAPTVALERVWNGDEARVLVRLVENLTGGRVAALMPYEIGGSNGLLPLTWAAALRLPVVDADGMGRAFPEMQMQSMHLAGIAASPVVLTDGRGDSLVIRAADNLRAERLVRGAAASLGGVCAGALYCMTGRQARDAAIPGSISRALTIGCAMSGPPRFALTRLREAIGAVALIQGKVVDVERRTGGGFVRGSATFEGTGDDAGRQLRLELQNEFLVAFEEGDLRAAVPDIICVLGADSGEPIVTERLRYGQRVVVAAGPGPAVWRSEPGLSVVGPRAFGYDVDWAATGDRETPNVG